MSAITSNRPATSQEHSASRPVTAVLAEQFFKALGVLFEWHERARDRRRLLELDDRMLRDIGLSSADVEHEISKKFWQA